MYFSPHKVCGKLQVKHYGFILTLVLFLELLQKTKQIVYLLQHRQVSINQWNSQEVLGNSGETLRFLVPSKLHEEVQNLSALEVLLSQIY